MSLAMYAGFYLRFFFLGVEAPKLEKILVASYKDYII